MKDIMPGSRVMVFDPLLFRDDVSTPLSVTVRSALVERRYGYRVTEFCGESVDWRYPDCVDVRFDHRPDRISHGHFTDGVRAIERAAEDE